MRFALMIGASLMTVPLTAAAQEILIAAAPSQSLRQAEVPPGPRWPKGALIGALAGGGAGVIVGYVVCSQTTVEDPAVDPTGRTERPSDCVIAVGVAGLLVGALIGHAIERSTGNESRFGMIVTPDGNGAAAIGARISF